MFKLIHIISITILTLLNKSISSEDEIIGILYQENPCISEAKNTERYDYRTLSINDNQLTTLEIKESKYNNCCCDCVQIPSNNEVTIDKLFISGKFNAPVTFNIFGVLHITKKITLGKFVELNIYDKAKLIIEKNCETDLFKIDWAMSYNEGTFVWKTNSNLPEVKSNFIFHDIVQD